MTTRYHVTPSWTDGDDLLSLDEQINRGLVTEDEARASWRWEHSFDIAEDRQYVSLWETLEQAQAWQAEHGGVVLAVETDGLGEWTCGEGHPVVMGWIKWDRIEVVS